MGLQSLIMIARWINPDAYEGHSGYDFALTHEPVLAAADGVVIRAGWWDWYHRSRGYGLFIEIDYQNGYSTFWDEQGRWVGPSAPVFEASHIVDDVPPSLSDPFFRKGHTLDNRLVACPPDPCPYWYSVTGQGYGGDMLWTYGNDEVRDYWALWIPPHPGIYEVQVFVPSEHPNMRQPGGLATGWFPPWTTCRLFP